MLFQVPVDQYSVFSYEVARRLINVEELEYTLETDEEPYEAACQGRFSSPEIIAVLGDVVRRLRLLKGTRAAIGRRGFGTDLQMLAETSVEDFMEALNIAKPSDSLGSACSRPGMTAKAKTALRTLLFSIPTCLAQRSGRLHFAVTGTGTTSSLARPDSSSHQTSRIPTTF